MGFTAVISNMAVDNTVESAAIPLEISSQPPVLRLTLAAIIVAISLVYLLAYLNLFEATDIDSRIKDTLIATIIPLFSAFCGIILYYSILSLGGL